MSWRNRTWASKVRQCREQRLWMLFHVFSDVHTRNVLYNENRYYLLFISPTFDKPKSVSFMCPMDVIRRLQNKHKVNLAPMSICRDLKYRNWKTDGGEQKHKERLWRGIVLTTTGFYCKFVFLSIIWQNLYCVFNNLKAVRLVPYILSDALLCPQRGQLTCQAWCHDV